MSVDSYSRYESWKKWSADSFGACDVISGGYFAAEMRQSGLVKVNGLRVIEIGFGNGVFADWCRKSGANYTGTEAIQDLVKIGCKLGFDMHDASHGLNALGKEDCADLIVSWDVFEHIEIIDLKVLLTEARTLLKPEALIIFRLPSGDSPFSRAIQHGDLTHRSILGSSAIRQLSEEIGFEVMQVREPRFIYFGLPLIRIFRRSIVELIRRVLFFVITNFLMGGGAPVLTPNMVVVLKKR